MPSTAECQRCQRFSGYLGDEFLVCAHSSHCGPAETPCLDFAQVSEQFEPLGGCILRLASLCFSQRIL